MKKTVVVRKKATQRYGILILYLAMICFSVLFSILISPLHYYGLLLLIGTIPVLCVWIYYQMWSISFSARHITIKCFLRKSRTYAYSQITDGYISNSYTLHRYVFLKFCDKQSCRFRMEDENLEAALKIIQAHRSLRWTE